MIDMENTKWDFKNGRILGKIEGKLWTLKMIIDGYCLPHELKLCCGPH